MKTICVKGRLSSGVLKYRPIGREFQNNNWYLKLNSVAIQTTDAFYEIVTVTCNFVTSEKYSDENKVETYEMPLQMWHFKLAANEKNTLRFNDPLCFKINSPSSVLEFKFRGVNDEILSLNQAFCRLCFTIDQR